MDPVFPASRRDMLRLALLGAATIGGLGLTARRARADTLADIKQRGELVVATEMQFPPFDFIENGNYRGVDRDLIDEVGKELGVKVKYIDLPWTSVLPGLDAKKFDFVIAPVTITQERMKRYAFTVPIADATAALMKRADDKSITKPQDLAGKTVGGQKGTAQLEQFKEFARHAAQAADDQGIRGQQPVLCRSRRRPARCLDQLAAQPRLCGAAAPRQLRARAAALRQAHLFLLGRPARRHHARRCDQRRAGEARPGRAHGGDPEEMARPGRPAADHGAPAHASDSRR